MQIIFINNKTTMISLKTSKPQNLKILPFFQVRTIIARTDLAGFKTTKCLTSGSSRYSSWGSTGSNTSMTNLRSQHVTFFCLLHNIHQSCRIFKSSDKLLHIHCIFRTFSMEKWNCHCYLVSFILELLGLCCVHFLLNITDKSLFHISNISSQLI